MNADDKNALRRAIRSGSEASIRRVLASTRARYEDVKQVYLEERGWRKTEGGLQIGDTRIVSRDGYAEARRGY